MGGPGSGNKAYGFGYGRGHADGLAEGLAKGRVQGAASGLGRAALVTSIGLLVVEVGRAFGPDLIEKAKQRWASRAQQRAEPVDDAAPADEAS